MRHADWLQRTIDAASVALLLAMATLVGWEMASHVGAGTGLVQDNQTDLDAVTFNRLIDSGQWIGPRSAPVVILVFSTYRCGFCAQLHEELETLGRRYPTHLAVVVKHFVRPEELRTFQVPVGAFCAGELGAFPAYNAAAFLGKHVVEYSDGAELVARAAGIEDSVRFRSCLKNGDYFARTAADFSDGVGVGVKVTPTLFVNGVRVVGAAPLATLDSMVAMNLPHRADSRAQ